jgi:hypothetical protein
VAVIASGPSLTEEDCRLIAGAGWEYIGVNDTWRRAPFADVIYACDKAWWDVHHQAVKKDFKGELWTQDLRAAERYGLKRVASVNEPGLGRFGVIHQGGNGGYQAINLAWMWGAKRIFLLGLDCKPGAGGKAHWFGQHENGLSKIQNYKHWTNAFPKLAQDLKEEGVEVINLTRDTALTCFKRIPLKQAIADYREFDADTTNHHR